jgi:uncharacterized phage-like protein YoqJ
VKDAIRYCYKNGARFFYAGGAVGFDTIAAEAVLSLKAELPDIVLIIVVPFLTRTNISIQITRTGI